jgi:hypothetical protein
LRHSPSDDLPGAAVPGQRVLDPNTLPARKPRTTPSCRAVRPTIVHRAPCYGAATGVTPSTSVDQTNRRIAAWGTSSGIRQATDQAGFLLPDDLLPSGADRAVVLVHHEDGGVSCPARRAAAIKDRARGIRER